MLWTEFYLLQIPSVKALNPTMIVFGDRSFKEVIKGKWGYKSEASIWEDCCPYKKETSGVHTHRGKALWEHIKKVVICKPRREASPESNPAGTLVLDFQPPGLWDNKPPVCAVLPWQPEQGGTNMHPQRQRESLRVTTPWNFHKVNIPCTIFLGL